LEIPVKRTILPIALLALLALALSPTVLTADDCGACPAEKMAAKKDIVDTAVAAGSFNTLVKAVQTAGLVDALKGDGPFTVFAPTDAAFAKLPAGTVEALLKDKAALTKILTYHVVSGKVDAATAAKTPWATTLQGQALRINATSDGVMIDNAKVTTADVYTSNGIIHVIDTVMLPRKDIVDTAVENGSFNTLVTAVKAADLIETLKGKGPFTVFAPVDSAFAKLPAGTIEALLKDKAKLGAILTYHVIPGRVLSTDLAIGAADVASVQGSTIHVTKSRDGAVTVDNAKVVKADIIVGNGVIHVIDSVILPSAQ
jgi:uncharacterized surface protein with fasciclin (FAS1) repeats